MSKIKFLKTVSCKKEGDWWGGKSWEWEIFLSKWRVSDQRPPAWSQHLYIHQRLFLTFLQDHFWIPLMFKLVGIFRDTSSKIDWPPLCKLNLSTYLKLFIGQRLTFLDPKGILYTVCLCHWTAAPPWPHFPPYQQTYLIRLVNLQSHKVASTSVISYVIQFFLLFLSSSLPLFSTFLCPFNFPSLSLLPSFPFLFQSFLLPISLLPWFSLLFPPSSYRRYISLDHLSNRSSVWQS